MSEADKVQLLRRIMESEWLGIDALIREKHPDMLADVVFYTHEGQTYLTGKAHCLSDDTEAFSLDFDRYPVGGRWKAGSGHNFLTTRDIKEELEANSMDQLLTIPRTVRFFTNPRFGQRVYPKEVGLLDNCAAIEFGTTVDRATLTLVLVASSKFPCEIEIATDPDACASFLEGLVPLDFPM